MVRGDESSGAARFILPPACAADALTALRPVTAVLDAAMSCPCRCRTASPHICRQCQCQTARPASPNLGAMPQQGACICIECHKLTFRRAS